IPIFHALMREVLRWDDLPIRWASLWTTVNDPGSEIPAADLRELAGALDRCASRFFGIHPEARTDPAIALHRASMLSRIAEKALATSRLTALSIFRTMLRRHPVTAVKVLPRFGALLLLGGGVLRLWRR